MQTCLPALSADRQKAGAHDTIYMYFVYAISSKTKKYIYVGLTNNLERRVGQHNSGKEKTTKPYAPFKLILKERYATRKEAREREKVLKSGYSKEWLKNL